MTPEEKFRFITGPLGVEGGINNSKVLSAGRISNLPEAPAGRPVFLNVTLSGHFLPWGEHLFSDEVYEQLSVLYSNWDQFESFGGFTVMHKSTRSSDPKNVTFAAEIDKNWRPGCL